MSIPSAIPCSVRGRPSGNVSYKASGSFRRRSEFPSVFVFLRSPRLRSPRPVSKRQRCRRALASAQEQEREQQPQGKIQGLMQWLVANGQASWNYVQKAAFQFTNHNTCWLLFKTLAADPGSICQKVMTF